MRSLHDDHTTFREQDVMTVEQLTDAYAAFCVKYGYHNQAEFEDLATIEDVLVLASVTLDGAHMVLRTSQSVDGHQACQSAGDVLAKWPERRLEARRLFEHAFHLREGIARTDRVSFDRAHQYFIRRSYELSTDSPYKPGVT